MNTAYCPRNVEWVERVKRVKEAKADEQVNFDLMPNVPVPPSLQDALVEKS
jgi:hypothetical protein